MKKTIYQFLKEIQVYDCEFQKVRIGNESDGGYVALHEVCDKTRTLYSFGVEDNITFEQDFVRRYPQALVKLFDHTVDGLPSNHPNFAFVKKGIAATPSKNFVALSSILDEECTGITLKMDIEWDEWSVLGSLSSDQLKKIDQMLVEFHLVTVDVDNKFIANTDPEYRLTPYFDSFYRATYDKVNDALFMTYLNTMKKINEWFYAFHIHPNNSLKKVKTGGYSFPPLLEISFVRKDLVKNIRATTCNFPISGLDFPNKPYKKEIKNYYPLAQEEKGEKC